MKLERTRLGRLDVHVVEPEPGPSPSPVVVLMHGFGAPGTDLVPLSRELKAPPGTRFVFPEAPHDLGPGYGGGRAWWHIDMLALQTAMATGSFRDLARSVPDGLPAARSMVFELLDAVEAELSPSRLAIGGFSQGAMLATDVLLRSPRSISALVVFSGTLIAESEWTPLFSGRKGLSVIQSHGTMDPILPYTGAERLRALFEEGGLLVDFVPFEGMHEIPRPAIEATNALFRRVLAP